MTKHEHTVLVTGLAGEPAFTLHCEPEGSEISVEPGDEVELCFSSQEELKVEISRTTDGIIIGRYHDAEVIISDRRGRNLTW